MNFLRQHWFDIGLAPAVVIGIALLTHCPDTLSLLLWLSLIALLLHQFEEYRFPGYFPGMLNSVLFRSKQPERYPLNTHSALLVNTIVGWLCYFLAALLGPRALWLGIATMLVSFGNIVAHTLLFNIKGKTHYNPGMLTSLLFFLPICLCFCIVVFHDHLASPLDWVLGIPLGVVLNYVGIFKLIDWFKAADSPYVFPLRCLLPSARRYN
ncbi:MAG TPA: HXXEE domain-containing protein [Chthonomonadaceae bacterium]|nr:HXXEE domain-containing protein [Chthonomonadaceae bacterium]